MVSIKINNNNIVRKLIQTIPNFKNKDASLTAPPNTATKHA